jgi:hypothetical protein
MASIVKKYIYIDSKRRNHSSYPSASFYQMPLPGDGYHKQVCNIDLVQAVFPKTHPIIYFNAQILQFQEANDNQIFTVEIPFGNYTINELVDVINLKMPSTITTSVSRHNGIITIESTTGAFQFLFKTGSLAHRSIHKVLGFRNFDTTISHKHVAEFHYNLDSSMFVDLIVPEIPTVALKQTHDYALLCRIPLNTPNFTYKYFTNEFEFENLNMFYPINLPSITIDLRSSDGVQYDTNGFDHHLTFSVSYYTSLLDPSLTKQPSPTKSIQVMKAPSYEKEKEKENCKAAPKPIKKPMKNALVGATILGGTYVLLSRLKV